MDDRQREVARQLGNGACYETLRITGVAREGDFERLVSEGVISSRFSGRHTLTDKGHNQLYEPTPEQVAAREEFYETHERRWDPKP